MIANIKMTTIKLYDTNISNGVSADIDHILVGHSVERSRMVAVIKNSENEAIASVPIAWSVNNKYF